MPTDSNTAETATKGVVPENWADNLDDETKALMADHGQTPESLLAQLTELGETLEMVFGEGTMGRLMHYSTTGAEAQRMRSHPLWPVIGPLFDPLIAVLQHYASSALLDAMTKHWETILTEEEQAEFDLPRADMNELVALCEKYDAKYPQQGFGVIPMLMREAEAQANPASARLRELMGDNDG